MEKQIKCAWCGEEMQPKENKSKNDFGHIIERRCQGCGKILAAYLEEDEKFFPDIRTF